MGEPETIVKIRMHKEYLEFDVFFARIGFELHMFGQDVTINWESLDFKVEKPGLFYTDANAFKIVRRDIHEPKGYNATYIGNKVQ
jgi:hypothetical protein